jgi:iron complex transport system substrate-binding protein
VEEEYPQVSPEAVVERDPDAIIGPDTHGDALVPEKIKARSGWDGITAIQDGNIYIIEGSMASRAGPRMVDLVETIAQLLYPEYFQE